MLLRYVVLLVFSIYNSWHMYCYFPSQIFWFYISTFRNICAVPNMAVLCTSCTSFFPRYVVQVFSEWPWEGYSRPCYCRYHFRFHIPLPIVKFSYFKTFSASFMTTPPSPEIAMSINMHVPPSLSRIVKTGFILWMVLSVCLHFDSSIWLPHLHDWFLLIFSMHLPMFIA